MILLTNLLSPSLPCQFLQLFLDLPQLPGNGVRADCRGIFIEIMANFSLEHSRQCSVGQPGENKL